MFASEINGIYVELNNTHGKIVSIEDAITAILKNQAYVDQAWIVVVKSALFRWNSFFGIRSKQKDIIFRNAQELLVI